MKSFIVIELIIISLMAAVMQVLGTRFDDGGNMDLSTYDTHNNDYPFISSFGVSVISAYRNAVGDLQMPTYEYWTAEGNSGIYPRFMIFLIWLLYTLFIFVLDLMALNFLIAIFSQSYESIMDRQIEAIIESKIELNQECLQELNNLNDEEVQADVDIIVMQTAINLNADSEWDGIGQTMKKSFVKAQVQVEELEKKLDAKFDNSEKENQELKNELIAKFENSKKKNQELNTKLDEMNAKFDKSEKEIAEIKAMLI